MSFVHRMRSAFSLIEVLVATVIMSIVEICCSFASQWFQHSLYPVFPGPVEWPTIAHGPVRISCLGNLRSLNLFWPSIDRCWHLIFVQKKRLDMNAVFQIKCAVEMGEHVTTARRLPRNIEQCCINRDQ